LFKLTTETQRAQRRKNGLASSPFQSASMDG
jgi:hypothetical protein